jgi:hypothetical protein
MATTYTNESYHYEPAYPRGDRWLMCDEATREYSVVNDVVRGPRVAKGCKIVNAVMGFSDEFDEDATPAGIAKVQLYDGTTEVDLVVCSATQAGTAGGFVQYLNTAAGLNYIVQSDGFYVRLIFTTAPDDVKTAVAAFGVQVSPTLWGDEQRQVES